MTDLAIIDSTKAGRWYLVPPKNSFWQWRDEGEVLAWADGKTIAFRAEIQTVLAALAPTGLPPFGAIALLLAATRDNWRETSSEIGTLVGLLIPPNQMGARVDFVNDVVQHLDRVRSLPADLRQPVQAKAALCQLVFQDGKAELPPPSAAAIVRMLDSGVPEDVISPRSKPYESLQGVLRYLYTLRTGLDRVDAETLRLRLKTGLDELPQRPEADLAPSERVRALLASLDGDEELHGLARLARDLMAAVTLPRALADHEDFPIGGVSDIANRGPLDRLLLSELAHDDLTLAVRVAMNEALYLRRESPPRTPPQQRAILLDAGIRSWGVPRVFTTAIALALAATTGRNMEVVAFRACGDQIKPVDLTTRAGLVAHLEALQPELHPGDALAPFAAQLARLENAAQPILVMPDDSLDDADFLRRAAESEIGPMHVAAVNRAGRFRLLERTLRGSKTIREAVLNLDDLFAAPRRTVPALIDRTASGDLPAIFGVTPFPLLLSPTFDQSRMWRVEGHGVLAVTKDRRLMLWSRAGRGAEQLADTLPAGSLLWTSRTALAERVFAVVGRQQPGNSLHLLDIDLATKMCQTIPLEVSDQPVKCVVQVDGSLFAIGKGHVDVLGLADGRLLERLKLPSGMTWKRDRFFRGSPNGRWYAISCDGHGARLEPVLDETAKRCPLLLTLFARHGVDGFMGVTARGDLYSTATGNLRRVDHGMSEHPQVLAISADGRRIVLGPANRGNKRSVVDVDTLVVRETYGDPGALAEPSDVVTGPLSLRRQASHICVDVQGVLTLITRKNQIAVTLNPATQRIQLSRNDLLGSYVGKKLSFKQVTGPSGVGYSLGVATWECGSRAFLDSRGLLHLKSADWRIPEVTIVLCDSAVAGWCSDGRLWGSGYFIGDAPAAPTREVFDSTIKPFAERLR